MLLALGCPLNFSQIERLLPLFPFSTNQYEHLASISHTEYRVTNYLEASRFQALPALWNWVARSSTHEMRLACLIRNVNWRSPKR
jgi:hypothetical protein